MDPSGLAAWALGAINDPLPRIQAPREATWWLVGLPVSLAEQQLSPGRVQLQGASRGRALEIGRVEERRTSEWQPLEGEALGAFRQRLRLPPWDSVACEAMGGCTLAGGECRPSCQDPELIPPRAPATVDLPQLGPCPPAWSLQPGRIVIRRSYCAPPPPLSCPAGQVQLPGDLGCGILATACAPDGLPVAKDLWYVDARAQAGGNGS